MYMFIEGSESQEGKMRRQIEKPEVTAVDIRATPPELDGTKIILQRHEKYIRQAKAEGEVTGSLTPESAEKAYAQTKSIIDEMFAQLSVEERKTLTFLVVGSNTQHRKQGMRSMETAEQVLAALNEEMNGSDLDSAQILNNRTPAKRVAPISKMQAPRFFDESPAYEDFLIEKYGDQSQEFWKAFEEDTHKEIREQLGAEGPDEMDARFTKYIAALSNYAASYHRDNPGKRLVIWGVSHYDTVSPYIKRHITKTDPHQFLAVDYGAGIALDIDREGNATSTFQDKEYNVEL